MAAALIKYETLDKEQIDQVMEGREPDPPDGWQDTDGSVSSRPGQAADGGDRTTVGGPAEQV